MLLGSRLSVLGLLGSMGLFLWLRSWSDLVDPRPVLAVALVAKVAGATGADPCRLGNVWRDAQTCHTQSILLSSFDTQLSDG